MKGGLTFWMLFTLATLVNAKCDNPNWSVYWSLELDLEGFDSSGQKEEPRQLAQRLATAHGFLLEETNLPAGQFRLKINESDTPENDKRLRERIDELIAHPAVREFANARRTYKTRGVAVGELDKGLAAHELKRFDEKRHEFWLLTIRPVESDYEVYFPWSIARLGIFPERTETDKLAERLAREHNLTVIGNLNSAALRGRYLVMADNASSTDKRRHDELTSRLGADPAVRNLSRVDCYFPTRADLFYFYYSQLRDMKEEILGLENALYINEYETWLLALNARHFSSRHDMDELARHLAREHDMLFLGQLGSVIGHYRLKFSETSACDTPEHETHARQLLDKLATHPSVRQLTRELRTFASPGSYTSFIMPRPDVDAFNVLWRLTLDSEKLAKSGLDADSFAERLARQFNFIVIDKTFPEAHFYNKTKAIYILEMSARHAQSDGLSSSDQDISLSHRVLAEFESHWAVMHLQRQNAIGRVDYAFFKMYYEKPVVFCEKATCAPVRLSGICCQSVGFCIDLHWTMWRDYYRYIKQLAASNGHQFSN